MGDWDEPVEVRADTAAFSRDVARMRDDLASGLGEGAARAGRLIEGSLLRAVRSGSLGFDDLKATALKALDEIAAVALRGGVSAALGGGSLGGALMGLLGLPGRATGGPVTAGRAYTVGERGPEVFVPTSSGRVETLSPAVGAREVRVSITINASGGNAGAGEAAGALRQSGRQVARAVKAALEG